MPWIDGAHCPLCNRIVVPAREELRACRCAATIIGIKPDGELHVAGPEGVARVPVFVPYRDQLRLPL